MSDAPLLTDERAIRFAESSAYSSPAGDPGLTVRQLFAAMAMQGALGGEPGQHLIPDQLARESVAHADALIRELSK